MVFHETYLRLVSLGNGYRDKTSWWTRAALALLSTLTYTLNHISQESCSFLPCFLVLCSVELEARVVQLNTIHVVNM